MLKANPKLIMAPTIQNGMLLFSVKKVRIKIANNIPSPKKGFGMPKVLLYGLFCTFSHHSSGKPQHATIVPFMLWYDK